MKCNKKKLLAMCVAGGMTVGMAVPAMALENEFHGMFRSQLILSNFVGAPSTGGQDDDSKYAPAFGYDPATSTPLAAGTRLPAKAPMANIFDQRARLYYTAKINDDLKIVTKWELDYAYWGNSSYATKRNSGGALGADSVQMETKNVYLDMNVPSTPLNLKIGMQPFSDSFKGFIFDADMAGILASCSHSNLSGSVGFFRWADKDAGTMSTLGRKTEDIYTLDAKYAVNKDTSVGLSYYFLDNKLNGDNFGSGYGHWASIDNKQVHMVGVNAAGTTGPVSWDGFFVYQNGTLINRHVSAFAADAAGRVKVGAGTAHAEALYVTGDKGGTGTSHGFVNAVSPLGAESDAYNGMVMLTRNDYETTYPTGIIYDMNNSDQGVIAGFIGYDFPVAGKLDGSANAGFAAIEQANGNPNQGANKSDYLGTEMNLQLNYKVNSNVKLIAQGAYVILGDYYKGVAANGETPDNPYQARLILNVTF